ncbi:MAG TPA: response regulator [Casimicrobiaceae bacterium]|nr:response regulator [Casimicrobiaceae bacterium]
MTATGEPILIVEDNPANRKLLSFLLTTRGYDVRAAARADEALEMLETFAPRLILMDLQLPGMDGLELTRRLKADPRTQHIVIIAVTAYAMKGDEERVRAAGCDGYVTKPIDTRALPQVIAAYLAAGAR